MKIITWNVNGKSKKKIWLENFMNWLENEKPDIVCLQEIKCINELFPISEFESVGYKCQVNGQEKFNGVATISKTQASEITKNFSDVFINEICLDRVSEARLIDIKINKTNVINVYVPSADKINDEKFNFKIGWLDTLNSYISSRYSKDEDVLLCGDFNVAFESLDLHNPVRQYGYSDVEINSLKSLKQWGFIDVFRKHNPTKKEFTRWSSKKAFENNQGWRIDYIWASESLAKKSFDCKIDYNPWNWIESSDHVPVVAEFAF